MTFTTDWFDFREATFRKHLTEFVGRENNQFLEIGSFEGKSACFLLENYLQTKNSHIFCIDTFSGSPKHDPKRVSYDGVFERFMENVKPFGNIVTVLKGKSQEGLRELPVNYFDFIYIDGSHVASDVLEDIILSWRMLKTNGIMAMDDYFWKSGLGEMQEPRMAIDAFLRIFSGQYGVLEGNEQVWIRKVE